MVERPSKEFPRFENTQSFLRDHNYKRIFLVLAMHPIRSKKLNYAIKNSFLQHFPKFIRLQVMKENRRIIQVEKMRQKNNLAKKRALRLFCEIHGPFSHVIDSLI